MPRLDSPHWPIHRPAAISPARTHARERNRAHATHAPKLVSRHSAGAGGRERESVYCNRVDGRIADVRGVPPTTHPCVYRAAAAAAAAAADADANAAAYATGSAAAFTMCDGR